MGICRSYEACDFGGRMFYKYVAPLARGNAASKQYQEPLSDLLSGHLPDTEILRRLIHHELGADFLALGGELGAGRRPCD